VSVEKHSLVNMTVSGTRVSTREKRNLSVVVFSKRMAPGVVAGGLPAPTLWVVTSDLRLGEFAFDLS